VANRDTPFPTNNFPVAPFPTLGRVFVAGACAHTILSGLFLLRCLLFSYEIQAAEDGVLGVHQLLPPFLQRPLDLLVLWINQAISKTMANFLPAVLQRKTVPGPIAGLPHKATSFLDALHDRVDDNRLARTGDGLKVIAEVHRNQNTESSVGYVFQPIFASTTDLMMARRGAGKG
jgi:hypothetical protein